MFAAQEKLNWAFKLYDIDNDGLVDQREMAIIMETLDDIEGVKSGESQDDGNGNPDRIPTPLERAASLFAALDRNNDGSLTRKEFVASYTQRGTILRRQDADEQKRRLNCLLLYGPHVNREVGNSSVISFVCSLINSRTNTEVVLKAPTDFIMSIFVSSS